MLFVKPLENVDGIQDSQRLATNVGFKFADAMGNDVRVAISPKSYVRSGEKLK